MKNINPYLLWGGLVGVCFFTLVSWALKQSNCFLADYFAGVFSNLVASCLVAMFVSINWIQDLVVSWFYIAVKPHLRSRAFYQKQGSDLRGFLFCESPVRGPKNYESSSLLYVEFPIVGERDKEILSQHGRVALRYSDETNKECEARLSNPSNTAGKFVSNYNKVLPGEMAQELLTLMKNNKCFCLRLEGQYLADVEEKLRKLPTLLRSARIEIDLSVPGEEPKIASHKVLLDEVDENHVHDAIVQLRSGFFVKA